MDVARALIWTTEYIHMSNIVYHQPYQIIVFIKQIYPYYFYS